jgi:hypothetical protein
MGYMNSMLIKFAFVTECHNYCQVKSVQHLYDHLYKSNVKEYINQYACLKGHTDIVILLLDNNCEIIDNNGLSPALHSACKGGSVDIVDLLLRNKCNINQCQPRSLIVINVTMTII